MTTQLEVDLESFAAVQPDAFLIDVREPDEYASGHVSTARLVPAGSLAGAAAGLPEDRTIYVICASGNRSLRAAAALTASGLRALSVAGGTSGWIRSGRPVVTGARTS
ncbi:MAG: rhodanese-like domain-containing protein [Actinobacteria bacterium]|nr:rhodanese-like domain-containing protein [Actinomycetota bacterium]